MLLEEINPYLRYAQVQLWVPEGKSYRKGYDCRIFHIKHGGGYVYLNDKKMPVKKGDVIYIPSNFPYYFEGKISPIVLNFDFSQRYSYIKRLSPDEIERFKSYDVLEKDLPDELNKPIIMDKSEISEMIISEIAFEYRKNTKESKIKTCGLLKALICDIVTSNREYDSPTLANQIMRFIQNKFMENISNSDIAEFFGYNPMYINRIFKANFGITIHKALLRERLAFAKKTLKESEISVETIAIGCGFANRSQFCTTFKKETGLTPNEYRKKQKSQQNNANISPK